MATEQKNLLTTEKFLRAVSDTFTVTGTPVAFMTKSGEALVFVSLTDEYVGLAAPRKAGKIRVLGMDRQTVAAGGY